MYSFEIGSSDLHIELLTEFSGLHLELSNWVKFQTYRDLKLDQVVFIYSFKLGQESNV